MDESALINTLKAPIIVIVNIIRMSDYSKGPSWSWSYGSWI